MIEVGQQYKSKVTNNLFVVTAEMVKAYRDNAYYRLLFDQDNVLQRRNYSSKKFWMVKGNGPTNFKHLTKEAAMAEAERLANVHRGKEIYVLEAVCVKKASKMETVDL
jgi:hypothetical protein